MNDAEIRRIVSEYFDKGGSKMNLKDLKKDHPELVAELKAEHYKEYLEKGGGSLEQAAGDQIAGKAGVKTPNIKPQHEKTEEERAADQIASRGGIRK